MEMLHLLRRLFAYDDWANREVARGLIAGPAPERSRRFLAHIVGAGWLWLNRMRGEPGRMAVWPELSPRESLENLEQLRGEWARELDALGAGGLTRRVSYRNTKGEDFANAAADILLHVVIHAAYHRGQIATDVRANGGEPAYTDFIHAVRQGHVREAMRNEE